MITYSINRHAVDGITGVITGLPPDTFGAMTRSTLPLIDYWRSPDEALRSLATSLGLADLHQAELSFEHQVPVAAGIGKASFTDLMVLAPDVAIAIEAKYHEPPYERVVDWLGKGNADNRRTVLDGWLTRVNQATGSKLDVDAVKDLPYQLLHRTASACSIPVPARAVVYQLFAETKLDYYKDALGALRQLVPFEARLTLMILTSPAQLRQSAAAAITGDALRQALSNGPMYTFGAAHTWSAPA